MKKIIAFILIFLAMLIWGTSFLVMKNALDSINSGFLIFLRSSITFLILLPLSFKYLKSYDKKGIFLIIITGVFVSIGYLTQAIGLKYTTPGKSAFLEDTYCIVVPILTCLILKTKPTIKNIFCILICLAGVVLISFDSLNGSFNIGDVLSIIAGVSYGINITLTGIYAKKVKANPISYTCLQFLVIAIISGSYSFIFEDNSTLVLNTSNILQVLYLGLVVTALAWIFRNYSQQILSPITVSIILPFSAVVGTILSIIAKEDTINTFLIVGGILITISILVDSIQIKKIAK